MSDGKPRAERITQHGSFRLDLVPTEAFKLFTAAGERLWVPGWAPVILGQPPQEAGLIFTTGDGADHTIWTVVESDAATGRVRYSRVTPASHAGIVTVEVTGTESGSLVKVSYDLTALGSDSEASLDAYAPAPFARMMIDWKQLIDAMSAEARATLAALVV